MWWGWCTRARAVLLHTTTHIAFAPPPCTNGAAMQCLGYLSESLETCEIAPEPADQSGRALFERLQILDLAEQLSRRVLDLKKNLAGALHELGVRDWATGVHMLWCVSSLAT
jgi:hypothetical protein